MANENFDIILKVKMVDEATERVNSLKKTLNELAVQGTAQAGKLGAALNLPLNFAAQFQAMDKNVGVINFDEKLKFDGDVTKKINSLRRSLEGRGGKHAKDSLSGLLDKATLSMERFGLAALTAAGGVAGIAQQTGTLVGGQGGKKKGLTIADLSPAEQALFQREFGSADELTRQRAERTFIRNRQLAVENRARAVLAENDKSAETPGGGLKGAASRVLLWGGAASVIYGGVSLIRKAISATIDLENEMVQLQKVMSDKTPFEEMKNQMFDLSSAMGVAIFDVTKIAKVWAQQGYEMQQTMSLTTITLDTMNALSIDAAQATDYLTSVMRVWGVEIKDLSQNLAGIMKVQADYAIESEDLAVIFTRIGAGVREAGDSMAELAGISTALRETTRKTASQIFTALKTIYAKSFQKESIQALEAIGIKTRLNATTFRSFNEILTDLSRVWDGLTDIERKNLAVTLGQTRYWSDFVALMNSFQKIAIPATAAFAQAWGEASAATKLQQQSLKNQLQGIASAAIEAGDAFGEKFFKPLLETISGPLKGVFGFMTQLPQTALTTAAIGAIAIKSFKTVVGFFPAYEKLVGKLGISNSFLSAQTKQLTLRTIAHNMVVGRQTTALGGLAKTVSIVSMGTIGYRNALAGLITTKLRVINLTRALGLGLASIGKSLLSFGAFTLALYGVEKVLDLLFSKKEKNLDPIPQDAIDKLNAFKNGVGELNTETGKYEGGKIFSIAESIPPLQELLNIMNGVKAKTGESVKNYQQLNEHIQKNDELSKFIKDKYGDIATSLAAQKKLWEDINTLAAIYNNLVLKNVKDNQSKVTAELQEEAKTFLSQAAVFSEELSKAGLGQLDADAVFNAIYNPLYEGGNEAVKEALRQIIKGTKFGEDFLRGIGGGLVPGIVTVQNKNEGKAAIFNLLQFLSSSADAQAKFIAKSRGTDILGELVGLENTQLFDQEKKANLITQIVGVTQGIATVINEEAKKISGVFGDQLAGIVDFNSLVNNGVESINTDAFVTFTDEVANSLTKMNAAIKTSGLLFSYGLQNQLQTLEAQEAAYKKRIDDLFSTFEELSGKRKKLEEDWAAISDILINDPNTADLVRDYKKAGKTITELVAAFKDDYAEAVGPIQDEQEAKAFPLSENLKTAKKISKELEATMKALAVASEAVSPKNVEQLLGALAKIGDLKNQILFAKDLFGIRAKFEEDFSKTQYDIKTKAVQSQEDVANAVLGSYKLSAEGGKKQLELLLRGKEAELRVYEKFAKEKILLEAEAQSKSLEIAESNKLASQYNPIFGDIFDIGAISRSSASLAIQKQNIQAIAQEKLRGLSSDVENKKILEDINIRMDIWKDQADSVRERTQFIRDTLRESLTDFESIQRTAGKSIIFDTLGKIGRKFQEQQAEVFVNSLIKGNLGQKLLPSLQDIEFNEKLELLGESTYKVIFSAFVNGATAATEIMGQEAAGYDQELMNYNFNNKGFNRTAASITSIGNVLSNIGLGQIIKKTGRTSEEGLLGQSIGSQVLPAILRSIGLTSPIGLGISSVFGSFGGGLAGIFGFGKKNAQQQETMVTQLNLIEQNTARTADLMEKFINIPGSVFIPPAGGFTMNVTVNGNGDANQIAGQVINRIRTELNGAQRTTGSRGYFLD